MTTANANTAVAILPVKRLENAKQRLSETLSPGDRRALAQAMYSDVLTALRRANSITRIMVVTADSVGVQIAAGHGAEVLDDHSNSHSDAALIGLQHALGAGAERALLVPLDCPLLDPAEIDALVTRATPPNCAVIIPDRHGAGTNALLLNPPDALTPSFGEGSRDRHIALATAQGSVAQVVEVPTLALDVDTPEDLDLLREQLAATRGNAAHTRGMLNQLVRNVG